MTAGPRRASSPAATAGETEERAKGGAAQSRPKVHGAAELVVDHRDGATRLSRLYHHDPLRFLFPAPRAGDPLTAVLATTSGGMVGGDRLDVRVAAGARSDVLVTAQAAEKVYRSAGPDCRVAIDLEAAPGACLEWLAQETILFDGARLRRTARIDAAADAKVLAGEILVFGRTARGERFGYGLARDAWEVRIDGRLTWADALHLDGDCASVIADPSCFGGASALGTVVYVGPDAGDHLDAVRAVPVHAALHAGATCFGPLLVVRLLGHDARLLRTAFGDVWSALRMGACARPPRLPRLWHV